MSETLPIPIVVVLSAAVTAAATDLRSWKIPNALTLPLLVSGLAYHGIVSGGAGLGASLVGVIFAFAVLIFPYLTGGMGAGDLKLLAGIGAWLGMPITLYVFLASSLAAGVYAAVIVLLRGNFQETWVNLKLICLRLTAIGRHIQAEDRVEAQLERDDRRHRLVPFGAMIAVGVVATLMWIAL